MQGRGLGLRLDVYRLSYAMTSTGDQVVLGWGVACAGMRGEDALEGAGAHGEHRTSVEAMASIKHAPDSVRVAR